MELFSLISRANVIFVASTFTDGVGHFTQLLADECAALMGYRPGQISAAQIRIGGVKGVLGVVQQEDLKGRDIRVRPSMIKLQGHISMNTLNVIKVCIRASYTGY